MIRWLSSWLKRILSDQRFNLFQVSQTWKESEDVSSSPKSERRAVCFLAASGESGPTQGGTCGTPFYGDCQSGSTVGNSSLKSGLPPWHHGVLFTGPPCSRSFADSWVRIHVLLSFVQSYQGYTNPNPRREAKYMMVLPRWCYVNENFKTLKWKCSTI